MKDVTWGIKMTTSVRHAMKRLSDENHNYLNADCIYDDIRVIDREIGKILKEGVICRSYTKVVNNEGKI